MQSPNSPRSSRDSFSQCSDTLTKYVEESESRKARNRNAQRTYRNSVRRRLEECERLRKRNAELERMLGQYQSRPPTGPLVNAVQNDTPVGFPSVRQNPETDAPCLTDHALSCTQLGTCAQQQVTPHFPLAPVQDTASEDLGFMTGGFVESQQEEFNPDTFLIEEMMKEDTVVQYLQSLLEPAEEVQAAEPGQTAVAHAAEHGHASMLRMLVEHGGNHATKDKHGFTPLHRACEAGHVETVEVLLSCTPSGLHERTNGGFTALHLAVQQNRLEVVKLMLEQGASTELNFPATSTSL